MTQGMFTKIIIGKFPGDCDEMVDISEISNWLSDAIGKTCNEKKVRDYKMLSLGFGPSMPAPLRGLPDRRVFEWSLGTFDAAWRVLDGDKILCESLESIDEKEIEHSLSLIELGSLLGIELTSGLDVRVNFSTGLCVEFMAAGAGGNVFYIIGPLGYEASYSYQEGWELRRWSGSSD